MAAGRPSVPRPAEAPGRRAPEPPGRARPRPGSAPYLSRRAPPPRRGAGAGAGGAGSLRRHLRVARTAAPGLALARSRGPGAAHASGRRGRRRAAAREARRGGAGTHFLPLCRQRGRRAQPRRCAAYLRGLAGRCLARYPRCSPQWGARLRGDRKRSRGRSPSGWDPPRVTGARGHILGNQCGVPCVFFPARNGVSASSHSPPSCSPRSWNENCRKPVKDCEFLGSDITREQRTMSTAGVAAQEMRVPLKTGFLHTSQGMGSLKTCWGSHSGFENTFFNVDPIAVAYNLNPSTEQHLPSIGHSSNHASMNDHSFAESCIQVPSQKSSPPPVSPKNEQPIPRYEDNLIPGFSKLSLTMGCVSEETPPHHMPIKNGPIQFLSASSNDRSSRPLPPLPISEDLTPDDVDKEVEFLTSSDTDFLLEGYELPFKSSAPSRRSFRGCGQINYAYFDTPTGPKPEDANPTQSLNGYISSIYPPPQQLHRRLRRSHSGPAGSLNKPVVRLSGHLNRSSPNSDEDKPEIPPRVPIPPRALKPDYRRWSAEVASSAYSDEDRPPKVPPREPLSRSNSRTPSPKSLPSYLNGVMPPTQSFAPDPKYVSSKALQRQNSEGSSNRVPCILPIIENGKKASSTHYYLLPERPPYLDKYEKFFREAEESSSNTEVQSWSGDCTATSAPTKLDSKPRMDIAGHLKRKHLSYVVSP
ncbi:LOW QUALITY PROTEIN: ERBB receptor feedback inhibitor 1 [Spheniscus humboldti]